MYKVLRTSHERKFRLTSLATSLDRFARFLFFDLQFQKISIRHPKVKVWYMNATTKDLFSIYRECGVIELSFNAFLTNILQLWPQRYCRQLRHFFPKYITIMYIFWKWKFVSFPPTKDVSSDSREPEYVSYRLTILRLFLKQEVIPLNNKLSELRKWLMHCHRSQASKSPTL